MGEYKNQNNNNNNNNKNRKRDRRRVGGIDGQGWRLMVGHRGEKGLWVCACVFVCLHMMCVFVCPCGRS